MNMKRALYTNKNIENVYWNDVKHGDKQQKSIISTFSFDFPIQLWEYININYKFFEIKVFLFPVNVQYF